MEKILLELIEHNAKLSVEEIAEELGVSTTELRVYKSIAKEERRSDLVATAKGLRDKGYSLNEIAKKMGLKEEIEPNVSLALGTSEINMMDFAHAYNTLANLGDEQELHFLLRQLIYPQVVLSLFLQLIQGK